MKLDATTKARIAVLNGEIDSVHCDNRTCCATAGGGNASQFLTKAATS